MEGGGGREQNFWPGFVDALSNVVLVMIFVVVVFVVTLFYYSQKLAQFKAVKFMEKKELQEQVATPSKNQPNISRLDDGQNPDAARLKLESQEQIKEIAALEANLKGWTEKIKTRQGKLVVTGVVGTLAYTEGRRRAYYRTIAVRNYLIDQGVAPTSVISRVVPGNENVESDSSVVIQYSASAK